MHQISLIIKSQTLHIKAMAQTSVVIPDDLYDLLQRISKETNRSISGLCAGYIEDGIYTHIERLHNVEVWKGMTTERKLQETKEEQEKLPESQEG